MPLMFATDNNEFLKLSPSLQNSKAGGFVQFVGKVRAHNHGKDVSFLDYEAHQPLAIALFDELEKEAKTRFSLIKTHGVHRLNRVEVGQSAVFIAVAAKHRHEAFMGCRFLIDKLKKTLPIWKKEVYHDGSHCFDHHQGCHQHYDMLKEAMLKPVARALASRQIDGATLSHKRILLVGAGGLGCPLALNLCALGIQGLTIYDHDHVSASNLARQFIYGPQDIGQPKAMLLRRFLEERYPFIAINGVSQLVDEKQAEVLAPSFDLIMDASDCPATKTLLKKTAFINHKPLISASVHQGEGEVLSYVAGQQNACPGCFSSAQAKGDACQTIGVLTHACTMVAAVAAEQALQVLSGEQLSTKLIIVDPSSSRLASYSIDKDKNCIVCARAFGKATKKIVRFPS